MSMIRQDIFNHLIIQKLSCSSQD